MGRGRTWPQAPGRRQDYGAHLLSRVVAPGGRLVVGVFNEERSQDRLEAEVAGWGHRIAGRTARPHRDPELAYKAFWMDA